MVDFDIWSTIVISNCATLAPCQACSTLAAQEGVASGHKGKIEMAWEENVAMGRYKGQADRQRSTTRTGQKKVASVVVMRVGVARWK